MQSQRQRPPYEISYGGLWPVPLKNDARVIEKSPFEANSGSAYTI